MFVCVMFVANIPLLAKKKLSAANMLEALQVPLEGRTEGHAHSAMKSKNVSVFKNNEVDSLLFIRRPFRHN